MDCMDGFRADSVLVMAKAGVVMRRDDDLARDLMLQIEDSPDPIYEYPLFSSDDDEKRRRYYHLRLLVDAGFLEETGKFGGVFRITNAGHDFIALTRKSAVWERTKTVASGLSGASLGILRDIALGIAREELRKLGLLPE